MSRLTRPVALAVLATLTFLPVSSPAGAAGETHISTGATQFVPALAKVPAGNAVSWINQEVANYPVLIGNHNVVPDTATGALADTKPLPTSSPLIKPGERWSCAAGSGGPVCTGVDGRPVQLTPGRYAYMCGIHPNHMRGILVVS